jgi:hypothetical protein
MTGKIQTGHAIRCESLMMAKKSFYRFKIDHCSTVNIEYIDYINLVPLIIIHIFYNFMLFIKIVVSSFYVNSG